MKLLLMRLGAVGAATVAVCWPTAGNAAAPGYQRVDFEATFTAVQDQSWALDETSTDCGTTITSHGSGKSHLEFSAPASFHVIALKSPGSASIILDDERGFHVTGTYSQDGDLTVTSDGGTGCGDGGGGGTPPPKDCGSRSLDGYVDLAYRDSSVLPSGPRAGSSDGEMYQPFLNCPIGGGDHLAEVPGAATIAQLFEQAGPVTIRGQANDVQSGSGSGYQTTTTTTWTLTLTRMGLHAVPGGPYKVTRGERVELDGSRSIPPGEIKSYKWTFAPGPGCPPGTRLNPGALKEGARTTVVALCPLRVTLTVSDGSKSDSATTTIDVVARKFKEIPFTDAGERRKTMAFEAPHFAFGLNRSLAVWSAPRNIPDRWVDPGQPRKRVTMTQVADPRGPFDGFWYLSGHNLKVERVIVINKHLLPGGMVYDINDRPRDRAALRTLVSAIRAHEQAHSTLAKAALEQRSPKLLVDLEAAFATGKATLLDKTSVMIRWLETAMKKASSEHNVKAELRQTYGGQAVSIIVPTSGFNERRRFVLAMIGDG